MIETKAFGKTGHMSTHVIFGGAALGSVKQAAADRTLELLLQYGINHIDTTASYGNGEAEKRVGPWMAEHRQDFFLATKTGMHTYQEARDEFHSSLERLKVDSVDHIQMHNLTDPDEWETAMGPGGALEALVEARDQGLTRFIGVTGHGFTAPAMHLKSIQRFELNSVLLACNYILMQQPEYARSFNQLVEACKERGIAVQAIKSVARRPWGSHKQTRSTWYEPLEDQHDIDRAVSWLLGNPNLFLITAADINVLAKILKAADKVVPRPSDDEMQALIQEREFELIFEGREGIFKS